MSIQETTARRDDAVAALLAGETMDTGRLDALARDEAEIGRFGRMCMRTGPMVLMSAGLRWDDELRHPKAPGVAARVRLADRVEVAGEEMTIMEATRRFATAGPGGPALADWSARGIRIGDAFGLEHPRRGAAPTTTGSSTDGTPTGAPPEPASPEPARGQNYSLF